MSDGEYLGSPVAIKHLRLNEGDSDIVFKVKLINLTDSLPSLNFHSAVMSRDYWLETLVPFEHHAPTGSCCFRRPTLLPHPH